MAGAQVVNLEMKRTDICTVHDQTDLTERTADGV